MIHYLTIYSVIQLRDRYDSRDTLDIQENHVRSDVKLSKELTEMTLQELWELFPVTLVAHNDKWKQYYDEIESLLQCVLAECPVERISHIGSTAVSGIRAKDIVDVLIEVSENSDIGDTAKVMEENGFIRMSDKAERISFNRGYTKDGFADKVFHVHLR